MINKNLNKLIGIAAPILLISGVLLAFIVANDTDQKKEQLTTEEVVDTSFYEVVRLVLKAEDASRTNSFVNNEITFSSKNLPWSKEWVWLIWTTDPYYENPKFTVSRWIKDDRKKSHQSWSTNIKTGSVQKIYDAGKAFREDLVKADPEDMIGNKRYEKMREYFDNAQAQCVRLIKEKPR